MQEDKLYKIDTELRKGYNVEYLTTIVYGTQKRVQEKQSEAVEKMLADYNSLYVGTHVESKVTLIEDVVVTLSRGIV